MCNHETSIKFHGSLRPTTHLAYEVAKLAFATSNNEARYEVVLLGLHLAKELFVTNLDLQCDSRLVASQLRGEYKAKNGRMEQYLKLV